MSLQTPIKIRMLQRKLYQKAKEEPSYRYYLLYDKMYREDILAHAYALARSNQGAPGVDGQSFLGIESQGLEEWLSGMPGKIIAIEYEVTPQRRWASHRADAEFLRGWGLTRAGSTEEGLALSRRGFCCKVPGWSSWAG